ncbi:hypothetical protein CLV62_1476 [Dysgonomonas alginatilytica]|uniref:DUF1349 domain-containing protein n=1 Tax=Dysgonomonas alginatilytica TaxID=1605892 RepID=A0A2V3PJR6_9BACT|nr:DUF1349 domain-containing protein [Dysgonomonas alginatilytica]PXV58437.1 hypothetical protein CLV62_1476 [Dysgonomonas alginatilytica]
MKTALALSRIGILFTFILTAGSLFAQQSEQRIKSIPYKLEIYNSPVDYVINDSEIKITSGEKTNLFNNPNGKSNVHNAPMILFKPEADFTLSAKVTGDLKFIYDVAALVVYQDEYTWAKFCYENSVLKEPTIVSVVTRLLSDDCNSEKTGSFAYLSIVKKENEFSFFYSKDGKSWKMIRNFHLETKDLKVGFAAHGSRGTGFTGIFSEIKYQNKALSDMRDLN